MPDVNFSPLLEFLSKVPSMTGPIGHGVFPTGNWWTKFTIDITHPLAWNVVQELGFVLNYLSSEERLPTVFKPVSPPPYLNGGPKDYLSWVIECVDTEFTPVKCAEWLEGCLPRPVDDFDQWQDETWDNTADHQEMPTKPSR
jgi:hypothetical protein